MSVKNIVLALTLMLLGAINAAFAQATEGISITVTVPMQSTEGKVIFGLHNQSSFMKVPLEGKISPIKNGKATVIFNGVTPGTYAVLCFHDRNNDDQMNFQANGMPLEDYGASNNDLSMGPPSWSKAKFEVAQENLELEIRM